MLTRPLLITVCVMTAIALTTMGSHVAAKPPCRDVHGRLDSVAADLDGRPDTLETVGTLRGGIHAEDVSHVLGPLRWLVQTHTD